MTNPGLASVWAGEMAAMFNQVVLIVALSFGTLWAGVSAAVLTRLAVVNSRFQRGVRHV